jgi:hypothetical protein
MTDYYTSMAAVNLIKCSKEDCLEFARFLKMELENEGTELCLQSEYRDDGEQRGLFIFSKDFFSLDELDDNQKVRNEIGRLIERAGEEYVEFGIANTASAMVPMGVDGGSFRIYKDGEIVYPEQKWAK